MVRAPAAERVDGGVEGPPPREEGLALRVKAGNRGKEREEKEKEKQRPSKNRHHRNIKRIYDTNSDGFEPRERRTWE